MLFRKSSSLADLGSITKGFLTDIGALRKGADTVISSFYPFAGWGFALNRSRRLFTAHTYAGLTQRKSGADLLTLVSAITNLFLVSYAGADDRD